MSGEIDLAQLADDAIAFDGGGLGRKLSVYRLPEADWSRRLTLEHQVTFTGGVDLPDVRRTDRGLSAGKFMAERRRLSREFCHLAL